MTTIEAERDKYSRMWAHEAYRRSSPGERSATHFRSRIAPARGDTVIDLGCGTGRGGAALAAKGFNVTLFDLVPSAVDEGVSLPFIEGNLWDLPVLPVFDWIFCTDVLEHIPPEHVDAALKGMAKITGKGGFLTIAHFQDGFGNVIGERLHLTVEPPDWWRPRIEKFWHIQEWETTGTSAVVLGGPK